MKGVSARGGLFRMKIKVNTWIVYRRPREPRELYAFAEQATMQKHLDVLMADSTVVEQDGRYYRAAK